MKKIKGALAAIILAAAVVACGGKKEGSSEASASGGSGNKLDGTWEIVKAEGTMADLNKGTNYIFDGEVGEYDENSTPNPQSEYAKSKYRGEAEVQKNTNNFYKTQRSF